MLKVKSVHAVADITGRHITSKWDVVGTDCGTMFYGPSKKRMYVSFGDTFGADPADPMIETNWRGTVVGYFSDFDTSRGIRWDGFLDDESGKARELIHKHLCAYDDSDNTSKELNYEHTKIAQGGIEINGSLYISYESIRSWGTAGRWKANFCGMLKSTDGGKTFTKLRDLTWVEPEERYLWPNIKELVEEDMDLNPTSETFDVESHLAPGFASLVLADGKDGYVYGYGRYSGRFHGLKICRVKKADFEDFDAYEYLTHYENGLPVWVKGAAGREAVRLNPERAEVIPAPMSNLSVIYNNYLGKWLLIHHMPEKGIYCRESETPYGPFSDPVELFTEAHPDLLDGMPANGTDGNRLYAGYTHELICREQGRIIPIIISQWYQYPGHPRYYASRIFDVELE